MNELPVNETPWFHDILPSMISIYSFYIIVIILIIITVVVVVKKLSNIEKILNQILKK